MEQLQFVFAGGQAAKDRKGHALVGVVASGNLEVMIEPAALSGRMEVVVNTAARGFGKTWQAVLNDFHARHPLADVADFHQRRRRHAAVVSLRLDQAVEAFEGEGG